MFGYILPEKPELKLKEFELFRAYYCGVCKSIGKRYGQFKRLALNYDSAFLAILISSILQTHKDLSVKRERCIAHPLKRNAVIKNNIVVDYASDINIALAYHKMRDNWKDEKSFLAAAGSAFFSRAYKKIYRRYGNKCDIIEKRLEELSKLESHKCSSMDMAAEPFAKLMEEIMCCSELVLDEKLQNILKWVGYNIGRWVYILDAFDDVEKDIKDKAYNPLVFQFEYKAGEDICAFKERIKPRVEFNLTYCLSQLANAYELLEPENNKGILDNIIYMGMLRKTEKILEIGSCSKVEKSV